MPLGAGAEPDPLEKKQRAGAGPARKKNKEPEPEPLEKKSGVGAGSAKKLAGSPALVGGIEKRGE